MFGIMIFNRTLYIFLSPVKSLCFQTFISSLKSRMETVPTPRTLEGTELLVNAQQTLEELNL